MGASDPALAECGSCQQPLHDACLQTALAMDSRCPLCRAELAEVGYRVARGSPLQRRPERRRLQQELEAAAGDSPGAHWARDFLADMRAIVDGVAQLIRRVESHARQQVLQAGGAHDEILSVALLREIEGIALRAEALRAGTTRLAWLPAHFVEHVSNIIWRVRPICESLSAQVRRAGGEIVEDSAEIASAAVQTVEEQQPDTQPTTRRRPSAAATGGAATARAAIRRRPAAASRCADEVSTRRPTSSLPGGRVAAEASVEAASSSSSSSRARGARRQVLRRPAAGVAKR